MARIRQVPLPILLTAVLIWLLSWGFPTGNADGAKKDANTGKVKTESCKACHNDPSSLVPKNHPAVKVMEIAACAACHKPDKSGKAAPNKFSTRIHMAHAKMGKAVDCAMCHNWQAGERFGLRGAKESWGKPAKEDMEVMKEIIGSWGTGTFMDALHGKANVTCSSCHGSASPKLEDTLDNARCLSCHGPMDRLAARSAPGDFPERNPHKSHLGEINCTVCHKAHAASETYCLQCHPKFQIKKIPGGKAGK